MSHYLARYNGLLDRLVVAGYVLPADRADILSDVQGRYESAPAGR